MMDEAGLRHAKHEYATLPAPKPKPRIEKQELELLESATHGGLRIIIIAVFGIAFLISLGCLFSVPSSAWNFMDNATKGTLAFNLLVGFCLVLLSYVTYLDHEEIERLKKKVRASREAS